MPNSIMRLAKKLEYNGFSELKILINKENEETGNLIVPINVKKTLELLDYKVLNIVSNKLKYSKTVYFLGVGDSLYYCEMMAQNLNCIEKSSAYCRNYHDIAYHCEHCDKNDILFFISASGENERLNLYAKQASQRGITIISATHFNKNTLSSIADISLFFWGEERKVNGYNVTNRTGLMILLRELSDVFWRNYCV